MILSREECIPAIHVSGCFVLFEGKFLLLHRSKDSLWGVPAGKQEDNETVSECIIREILEETGLQVEKPSEFRTYYCRHDDTQFSYTVFSVAFDSLPNVVLNEEHTEYRWVSPSEALTVPLVEDEEVCIRDFFDL